MNAAASILTEQRKSAFMVTKIRANDSTIKRLRIKSPSLTYDAPLKHLPRKHSKSYLW